MVAGAAVGRRQRPRASAHGRHPAPAPRGRGRGARARVALLPAVGLHLALGLPTGTLEHRVRRGIVIAGYVAAVALAAAIYAQRPASPDRDAHDRLRCRGRDRTRRIRPPLPGRAHRAGTGPPPVGGMGCRGRRRDLARGLGAHLLVSMAPRRRGGRGRFHAARAVRARSRCIRSARSAHRPPPRAQHHAHRACRFGRRVVSAHRARTRSRSDRQREDAARPVDARGSRRGAAVGPGAERLTDLATRRVDGEGHAPDEVLRTFGSRLTRALRSTSCSSNSRSRSRRR